MTTFASEPVRRGDGRTLTASLVAAYRAFRSYRMRRRTVLSLSKLSDHDLKDIGVTRSEISSIAYGLQAERRRSHDDMLV